MKGLIIKDFLLIKGNLKSFLIIVVSFTLFSLNGTEFDASFILPFIAIMMFISTFSWDEFNNFNAYLLTLPIGRKNIVKSKYISAVIFIIIAMLISLLISFLTNIVSKNTFAIETILANLLGTVTGLAIIISIWLPLIYKFGIEKGRIMLFVLIFSIVFIGTIIKKFFTFNSLINFIESFEYLWFIIIPLMIITAIVISYMISIKVYSKKEF